MSLKNLALFVLTSALVLAGCDSKPPVDPGPPPAVAKKLAFTVQPSRAVVGAALAPAVQVTVQDADGKVVTGAKATVRLTLQGNAAGATLSGAAPVEAVQGVATFSGLSVDTAGEGYTLVARAEGLEDATSQAFTIDAGAASRLAFVTEPGELVAGGTFAEAVRVSLSDASGNPVETGTPVTLALGANPAGATLSGTLTVTTVDGVASFPELSLDKAGEGFSLVASAPGLEAVSSQPFRVKPGAARTLVFVTQPASGVAGQAFSPAVQVRLVDAHGNTATDSTHGITVALGANASGGTLGGTLTVAAVDGVATFPDLSVERAGTGYTLTASGDALDSATSEAFDVAAGAAMQLAFRVQPLSVEAGASLAPAVEVVAHDAFGNVATGFGGAVTLALDANPSGDTLAGTVTVNAVAGVARFESLSLHRAGAGYSLAAGAPGLTSAVSAAFDVVPASAARLAFVAQPSNAGAGMVLAPAVRVRIEDSHGNPVTSSSASVTVALASNPGSATLSGTLTVSASGGVATFADLSLDKMGTGYTLIVSSSGLASSTSTPFNVTPGAAARLAFSTQPTDVAAGTAISPAVVVRIEDTLGNLVAASTASVTIAIGNNPGVGILNGTKTVSAVGGVATFPGLSITKTGSGYTLRATSTGLTAGTSEGFNVTPGAATSVSFYTNPPNLVSAGVAISPSVKVGVRDAYNNTVTTSTATITVTLVTNPGGSTLGGTLTVNAVDGVAVFPDLTLNKVANNYRLSAASPGLTSNTSALFSVVAGPASQLAFTSQPTHVEGGKPFNPSVRVTVRDAQGNTVTNPPTQVTIAIGDNPGGATLSGTTTVSTITGVANFSTISLDTIATGYTLVASASGLSSVTSNAFDVTGGPPTQLAFTVQPSNATAGEALAPAMQVSIQDAGGNLVTSATMPVTLAIANNPGGGTLAGPLTVNAVAGVATFPGVSLAKAGTGYTLSASATGLSAGTSAPFNVTAAAPSQLAFSVQPERAFVDQPLNPAVKVAVRDAFGNDTSASVPVTVALNSGASGAQLSGTSTVSTVNGVATFADLTVDRNATGLTLSASAAGFTSATSAAFEVVSAGGKLVYVDPAAGGKLALVRNPASTDFTVVLDLVAREELTGYSVGMNLPVDASLVAANASLLTPGNALPAGTAPTAAYGKLPESGPLAGVLSTGQSQKAAGAGAVVDDSAIPAGSVLYTVRLDLKLGATTGVVFDGQALGPKFRAMLRNKLGTDMASSSDFAIGRLEVQ